MLKPLTFNRKDEHAIERDCIGIHTFLLIEFAHKIWEQKETTAHEMKKNKHQLTRPVYGQRNLVNQCIRRELERPQSSNESSNHTVVFY